MSCARLQNPNPFSTTEYRASSRAKGRAVLQVALTVDDDAHEVIRIVLVDPDSQGLEVAARLVGGADFGRIRKQAAQGENQRSGLIVPTDPARLTTHENCMGLSCSGTDPLGETFTKESVRIL